MPQRNSIDLGRGSWVWSTGDGRLFFGRPPDVDVEINNIEMFVAALPKEMLLKLCRTKVTVQMTQFWNLKLEALSRIGSLRQLVLLSLAEDSAEARDVILNRIEVIKEWKKNMEGLE